MIFKMSISADRLIQDEYENQFFDMSSTDLSQRFRQVVQKIIQSTLADLEKEILKTGEYNKKDDENVQDRINKLYTLYMNSAKIPLDKFEEESREIFAISSNILFKEDLLKVENVTDNDIQNLKEEVLNLEKELIREKVFLAKCQQMKEVFDTNINPIVKKMDNIMAAANRSLQKSTRNEETRIIDLYTSRVQCFGNNDADISFIGHSIPKKRCFTDL
ncbi:uncharacterized protein LOC130896482 [Diorhabda carinulata]|uniref:uncharacterized protein LOC130896482 n=1 Tax=Diorhabda carinulata TaxID=1163345 RepID=UPI0025A120F5|nr:uncharacterized protein LOC130896482 [Diorhabda carinulata]XP_057660616.1 uncharacterized protein LOC130896482 [Diorhabda carinulata]